MVNQTNVGNSLISLSAVSIFLSSTPEANANPFFRMFFLYIGLFSALLGIMNISGKKIKITLNLINASSIFVFVVQFALIFLFLVFMFWQPTDTLGRGIAILLALAGVLAGCALVIPEKWLRRIRV